MNIEAMLNLIKEVSAPSELTVPWVEEAATMEDIPDFLLVKNRVPLTEAQKARLAAVKVENPSVEEKWQRNRRLYEQEGERQKALKAAIARPAALEYFAKKQAEATEIKAVKDAAKKAHGK